MTNSLLDVVILAAGQGKRMCSTKPKVLHTIANKPILEHVTQQSKLVNPSNIHIVYGHKGNEVKAQFANSGYHFVEQMEQLGTGHAVLQVLPFIKDSSLVLILVGDAPLITGQTLTKLVNVAQESDLALLTANVSEPYGLGRIISDNDAVQAIIEEKDATPQQKLISEINSGVMVCKAEHLQRWLPNLHSSNAQGEFYLTDIVAMAVKEDLVVNKYQVDNAHEVMGINDLVQLEQAERFYQLRQVETLMRTGVSFKDKQRVDIRGSLICGSNVSIDVNVIFEGDVVIANNVTIGANCIVKNSNIASGAIIHANSIVDGSTVGNGAQVGPYARIRPDSELGANSRVGNFVELKKSILGPNSKASHLSYIGDCTVGEKVNIGAGTITCNYDGINKHQTTIGSGAFIGSGSQLIAPINVGENATIGAGTTLRRSAPSGELTLSMNNQKTIKGWQRKNKN